MRRTLLSLLLASSLLLLLPGSILRAHDLEVGGVYYGLIGTRRAYVTHRGDWSTTYKGRVVIPSEISYDGHTYSVTSVGENAFAGCDELTYVQLPSTVKSISPCAFLGCSGLRQVSVPETILVFNSCAFTGCTSLQQITLPRHAEFIDSLTFYCCASLKSIVLPHRIRKVCQGALEHLPALTDLYCFSSIPPTAEQGAFTPSDQQRCTLHGPAESVDLYRGSLLWRDFYNIVPLSNTDYTRQKYQRGDVNDDGQIDNEDLALMRRLIVRLPDNEAVRWAADINADGTVNAVDYVPLAKKLK